MIREIGRGGMGVVYECEQPSPRRRVAIKLVDALRYSTALERRFAAEAELQGRLQHPGIAQIYEAGAADVADERLGGVEVHLEPDVEGEEDQRVARDADG